MRLTTKEPGKRLSVHCFFFFFVGVNRWVKERVLYVVLI